MSRFTRIFVGIWSLLFLALGCNSSTPAPVQQRSAATTRPISASAAPTMTAAPKSAQAPAASTAPSESLPLAADPYVIADAKKTVAYLASDECEGRGVGTKGLDIAADYIANRFASMGLRKLPGQDDYLQRFDFVTSTTISSDTTLALNGN